jgi:uncharacterized membrane protein (UPF0127 family)
MKQCDPGYIWDPTKNKCVRITGRYSGTWWGVYIDRNGKKKNGKNGNGNGNGNGSHNGNGSSNGNGGSNGGGNGNGGGGGVSEGRIRLPLRVEIPKNSTEFELGLMFRESLDENSGMFFAFDEVGQKSFHMKDTKIPLDIAFIKEDGIIESIKHLEPFTLLPVSSDGEVLYALEVNRGWFAENNVNIGDKILQPLNENVAGLDIQNVEDGIKFREYEFIDIVKPEPIHSPTNNIEWEDVDLLDLKEVRRLPQYNKPGNIIEIYLAWRGRTMSIQMFFPQVKKPSRKEVVDQMQKVYPGAKLWSYRVADYDPETPLFQKGD